MAKTKTTPRKVECFGESGGKNLKTRIQCLKCDKKFASISTIRRHHKTFHEPNFECLHCPATFPRKHGAEKHITTKHQEKPITDFNEKTAAPKAAADPIAKWVPPVEAQTKYEMTPKFRIMAAPPKYTAPIPIKIQETPEMPSMDILEEDLQLCDSEDSDDDVIYVKTTGPQKYSTNSYRYLVEEVPTYQTTNCYKTYKGPVQSSSQETECRDEPTENNWMSLVTVRGIYNIFTSDKQ
ncbi:KRAB [Mytilus coruscus]|uniref:KRAB n=1 Tax=Mytilus coruscus TaxID=42192 RepID=A0A6J8B6K4_MYTCO|nr:KRAB [Mytilus coruscus]